MSEFDLFSGADLSPMEKALALSARDDALAAAQERREAADREAAREARTEALEWANRRGGDPVGELRRARESMTTYDDQVRDLSAQLEKATAKRDRAQGNLEYWSKKMGEVTATVTRSAPDDLLAPAKRVLAEHQAEAARARVEAMLSGPPPRPRRRPKGEVSRSRGAEVRRSEFCYWCQEAGVDDSTSYLLHSDPEFRLPTSTKEQAEAAEQQAEAARLQRLGYSQETAQYAAIPAGREIVR